MESEQLIEVTNAAAKNTYYGAFEIVPEVGGLNWVLRFTDTSEFVPITEFYSTMPLSAFHGSIHGTGYVGLEGTTAYLDNANR